MTDVAEPTAYAYLCVRARAANAHGDAVLASLPIAPDEVHRRRDAGGDGGRWKRPRITFKTPNVWIDVFFEAPSGTECGGACGYCGLERPAPDEERVVDVLNGWGPYHGIADARLAVGGLYGEAARPVTESWQYLYACIDNLGVFVLAGRPFATSPRRDGAVAVGVLLKRLRARRKLWRAIRSREDGFAEFRVQHWANARRAGAWLRRRDLRRMAKLDAGFFDQIIADPKPSFREDGQCNHCAYVQAWSAADAEGVVR